MSIFGIPLDIDYSEAQALGSHSCIIAPLSSSVNGTATFIGRGAAANIWLIEQTGSKYIVKILRLSSDHLSTSRMIAQKVDAGSSGSSGDFARDLRSKVTQWLSLQHQNLVRVIGMGELFELQVEYCECGTARQYLEKCGHSIYAKNTMIQHILSGVNYLHSRDPPVVHGSLRLDKMFVDEHGTVKVGEFGLASLTRNFAWFAPSVSQAGLTRWMSPELINIKPNTDLATPTTASDVWAFGCTVSEIMTAETPYQRYKHELRARLAISKGELPWLEAAQNTSFPWSIILRCWDMRPDDRTSISTIFGANSESRFHFGQSSSNLGLTSASAIQATIIPKSRVAIEATDSPERQVLPQELSVKASLVGSEALVADAHKTSAFPSPSRASEGSRSQPVATDESTLKSTTRFGTVNTTKSLNEPSERPYVAATQHPSQQTERCSRRLSASSPVEGDVILPGSRRSHLFQTVSRSPSSPRTHISHVEQPPWSSPPRPQPRSSTPLSFEYQDHPDTARITSPENKPLSPNNILDTIPPLLSVPVIRSESKQSSTSSTTLLMSMADEIEDARSAFAVSKRETDNLLSRVQELTQPQESKSPTYMGDDPTRVRHDPSRMGRGSSQTVSRMIVDQERDWRAQEQQERSEWNRGAKERTERTERTELREWQERGLRELTKQVHREEEECEREQREKGPKAREWELQREREREEQREQEQQERLSPTQIVGGSDTTHGPTIVGALEMIASGASQIVEALSQSLEGLSMIGSGPAYIDDYPTQSGPGPSHIDEGLSQTLPPMSFWQETSGPITGHQCDICGMVFRRPGLLSEHLNTHAGVYPYECNICGQRFAQRGNADRHARTVHQAEPVE